MSPLGKTQTLTALRNEDASEVLTGVSNLVASWAPIKYTATRNHKRIS